MLIEELTDLTDGMLALSCKMLPGTLHGDRGIET